jgi:hypothetical protein
MTSSAKWMCIRTSVSLVREWKNIPKQGGRKKEQPQATCHAPAAQGPLPPPFRLRNQLFDVNGNLVYRVTREGGGSNTGATLSKRALDRSWSFNPNKTKYNNWGGQMDGRRGERQRERRCKIEFPRKIFHPTRIRLVSPVRGGRGGHMV